MRLASALRAALPAVVFALLLGTIFVQQPRTMSYFGVNLLLSLALPVLLASMSQMLLMAIGDLDLSIGSFVSLVTCITAAILPERPLLGVLCLIGLVALYGCIGLLIAWRELPSVVVTLGLSFVWLGLAVILLPTPRGDGAGLARHAAALAAAVAAAFDLGRDDGRRVQRGAHPGAADATHHRDAVERAGGAVGGDQRGARAEGQATAAVRRLHHVPPARHSAAGDPGRADDGDCRDPAAADRGGPHAVGCGAERAGGGGCRCGGCGCWPMCYVPGSRR